jgi:hypothetical protein
MHRRKWAANTKGMIGLHGLQGQSVVDLCPEHQSSHSLSYQWRAQFLAKATSRATKRRAWRASMAA